MPLQMHAAEDLIDPLEAVGCAVVGRYGVRCVNDYIANNDPKHDPDFFAQLEGLELALSDQYPYYLLARFFQLVARRTNTRI